MLGKICHEINQHDRTTKDLATQNGRRRVQNDLVHSVGIVLSVPAQAK